MNLTQVQWITDTGLAAQQAGHIFPVMAACEAALESAYGESTLAKEALNLFGMKQSRHPRYGTISLPTREFLDGEWVEIDANWISYPTVNLCFLDRMATLRRLAPYYPHYQAALDATDEQTYIIAVSQTWSTDPARASKVLAIHTEYLTVR
jgi:flagellum-specific peptidoglycan hydrolase FlgJ